MTISRVMPKFKPSHAAPLRALPAPQDAVPAMVRLRAPAESSEECGYYRLYLCRDRLAPRWGRKFKCNCCGYWFVHRRGSKWCDHNPKAGKPLR